MKKLHLGVLYGSRSCEHEVSIISALQLIRAIDRSKYDVTPVYITQQGEWYTGERLMDMALYTDFDPFKAGLKRVSLDLTAGSGALIHYEPGKGLLRGFCGQCGFLAGSRIKAVAGGFAVHRPQAQ